MVAGWVLIMAIAFVLLCAAVVCLDAGRDLFDALVIVVMLMIPPVLVVSSLALGAAIPWLVDKVLVVPAYERTEEAAYPATYDRLVDIGEDSDAAVRVSGSASLWEGQDGSLLVSAGDGREVRAGEVPGEPLAVHDCATLGCVADAVMFDDPDVADTHVSAGMVLARSEDGTVTEYLPLGFGGGYLLLARADLAGAYQAALDGKHRLKVYGDTGFLDPPAPKDDDDPLERLFEARPSGPAPGWLKWVLLTGGVGVVAGAGVVTWRGARRKEAANEKSRSGRW